jgi:phosphoribosylanthranilate isomerase
VIAKIKFCGIMQTGDAAVADEAGAAYLGVVFAGGPGAVTIVGCTAGIEGRPGIKDPNTIARFVEAVFAHS